MKTYDYKDFALEISDPIPVYQGGTWEEIGWGPEQFPALNRTRKGHILYTWCTGADSAEHYEDQGLGDCGRVSEDGGRTWRKKLPDDIPMGFLLPDGSEFFRPAAKNAFPAPWLARHRAKPEVGKQWEEGIHSFLAADVPEYPMDPVARRYDPQTGETSSFPLSIDWPGYRFFVLTDEKQGEDCLRAFPMDCVMGNMSQLTVGQDGVLYMSTYAAGYIGPDGKPLAAIFFLSSRDKGRSWKLLSTLATTPEAIATCPEGAYDGFCEPTVNSMPDGSFLMLTRLGSNAPSYWARSTDGCRTWTKPAVFDKVGVCPQLKTLGCGITFASYGRFGVFLRATSDPSGLKWEAPVDMGIEPGYDSCCYTQILPLSDTELLMAYSHFHYPNPAGVPVKTLLARRVRVK